MKKDNLSIIALGDIALYGVLSEKLKIKNKFNPFVNLKNEFKRADLVIGNLENPLTDSKKEIKKAINVAANPNFSRILHENNINIVTLGNNHIFDRNLEGFKETKEKLKKEKIKFFGGGEDIDEAKKLLKIKFKNCTVGFIGYCDESTNGIFCTSNNYGCVKLDINEMIEDIKNIRKEVDFLIVSLHWGVEFYNYPSPEQIKYAHKIIDSGADFVWGHHSHVIQGVEMYKEKLIAYNLGNFIISDIIEKEKIRIQKEEAKKSFILKLNLEESQIKNFEIIPIKLNEEFNPILMVDEERINFLNFIDKISKELKSKDYGKFWREYVRQRENNEIKNGLMQIFKHPRMIKKIKDLPLKYFFVGLPKFIFLKIFGRKK